MNKLPERIRIKDIARLADVSVGTVDRVIHGRSGVSEASKKRVEKILEELDYHPNMYASALASNKKYNYACLLPMHAEGEYWTAIEKGIDEALSSFSDFNISAKISYYDPYDYNSFVDEGNKILKGEPDGVLMAPTAPQYSKQLTDVFEQRAIPYIYIDSNIAETSPLAFFGQYSHQSGYFSARMLMMMAGAEEEVVIFRQINAGIIGSNQQRNREVGFKEYMQKYHPSCKILELNLAVKQPNEDKATLDEFFRKHPNVRTGITFNSKVYVVGEYLEKSNISDFNLMGYDLLERNVACLKKGCVTLLIAQQPEIQGFNGIKALCDHLILRKEVETVNYMPIDLLSKENIDFYLRIH